MNADIIHYRLNQSKDPLSENLANSDHTYSQCVWIIIRVPRITKINYEQFNVGSSLVLEVHLAIIEGKNGRDRQKYQNVSLVALM